MDCDLLNSTKKTIKSLVISSPNSNYTIHQLNKDFKNVEGKFIPFGELGYNRLDTFLRTLSAEIMLEDSGTQTYVYALDNPITFHLSKMISSQNNSKKTSRSPKHGYSNKNNHRSDDNQRQFRPEIQNSFINHQQINTINNYPQPSNKNCSQTTNKFLNENNEFRNHLHMKQFNSNLKDENMNKSNNFTEIDALPFISPDDPILRHNTRYASNIKQNLFSNAKINEFYEIFISEINSPNRFWFYLASEFPKLDILMTHIENYYSSFQKNELLMNIHDIKPRQICCAPFYNFWHRGEIVSDIRNSRVKINFVDYGTTSICHIKHIKYLVPKFAELPRQAISGTLYGIKSIENQYKKESSFAMLNMVKDLKLYCRVKEINQEGQIISMVVYDTNKAVDIIINKELVTNGFAKEINPII